MTHGSITEESSPQNDDPELGLKVDRGDHDSGKFTTETRENASKTTVIRSSMIGMIDIGRLAVAVDDVHACVETVYAKRVMNSERMVVSRR